MARNYKRDYDELPKFAKGYIGKSTFNCIYDYSKKRKVVIHRIGTAFWNLVDEGIISVDETDNDAWITGVTLKEDKQNA